MRYSHQPPNYFEPPFQCTLKPRLKTGASRLSQYARVPSASGLRPTASSAMTCRSRRVWTSSQKVSDRQVIVNRPNALSERETYTLLSVHYFQKTNTDPAGYLLIQQHCKLALATHLALITSASTRQSRDHVRTMGSSGSPAATDGGEV